MLDGVDMNEVIDNLLPYQPSTDALAEVRVDTNNYSAEYGNVAGAVIGSTIKSGTNEFHGTAFEYWRDSSMAANSWDNNRVVPAAKKADLSQHIFGATLGGPLIKNKLFFFGDYQGFIRDRPGELVRSVAPEAWRQGDFSGVGVTDRRSPDRASPSRGTGSRRAGSARSRRRSSPTRRSIRSQPFRRHRATTSRLRRTRSGPTRATSKLDWNASSKDRLFLRVSYQHYTSEPERAPLPSNLASINDSPFFGLAAQLDAHRERQRRQRAAGRLHARSSSRRAANRLGRHRRRQRVDRHPRRPGRSPA